MIYRCAKCNEEICYGVLPDVTSGLLTILPCAGFIGLEFAVINDVNPHGFGRYVIVVIPLVVLVAMGLTALGIIGAKIVEWLCVSRHACPKCQGKKWSWGFTQGLGV